MPNEKEEDLTWPEIQALVSKLGVRGVREVLSSGVLDSMTVPSRWKTWLELVIPARDESTNYTTLFTDRDFSTHLNAKSKTVKALTLTKPSTTKTAINLVLVQPWELGFHDIHHDQRVIAAGLEQGLNYCPRLTALEFKLAGLQEHQFTNFIAVSEPISIGGDEVLLELYSGGKKSSKLKHHKLGYNFNSQTPLVFAK